MAFSDLTEYLTAARTVLELFKGIKSELPKGPRAERAEAQIQQAEQALRAAESKLAKELGYTLCQCTFSPQIMLSKGRHAKRGEEIFRCAQCGKQEPSEHYFRQMDEVDAYNAGLADDDLTGRRW